MTDPSDSADYGPGGYLPPAAAKRARKIVLREQMGLHWPIAAVVAGVVILAISSFFVLTTQGPPTAPFVAAGSIEQVPAAADAILDVDGQDVLVVRAAGGLSGFLDAPAGARWCPESRRIEGADGMVWSAQGRLLTGGDTSLRPVDVVAYDGTIYVDPTSVRDGLPPLDGEPAAACGS